MIIKSKCPKCGIYNNTKLRGSRDVDPVECKHCNMIYIPSVIVHEEESRISEETEFEHISSTYLINGSVVDIDNKESPLHGEIGIIIGKDNVHYRLKLKSDGRRIWVPYHWVKVRV